MTYPIITIDGPSSSGKGTIAKRVAAHLGWQYLDSGALYRLCALSLISDGGDMNDQAYVAALAHALPIRFENDRIFFHSSDVSAAIREENIGMLASKIAAYPSLRQALLDKQRQMATQAPLVADGRDMGTVVFPQANLKIFVTADAAIRAARRVKQLHRQGDATFEAQVLRDIQRRDAADQSRQHAPLTPAADAHFLDNGILTIDEAVQKVIDWYQQLQN